MKRIALLGSTGSIGKNALRVINHLPQDFKVTALAAKSNIDLLEKQAKAFNPEVVAVFDEKSAHTLQKRLPQMPVLAGPEGVVAATIHSKADLLLSAISGFDGVLPTLKAIDAKIDVALANKEALVAAGPMVVERAKAQGVKIIPVDSEHTAIFQCLIGEDPKTANRIILTASGGPFRDKTPEQLAQVTIDEALKHPNYQMGSKVTIDSSTLMNKGLEMIEAHFLYNLPIDVLIHPEQVIHSMVEFVDGSIMAQMGEPTMLHSIQFALTYPERKRGLLKPFDCTTAFSLNFYPGARESFRCLDLAYSSLREGGSMPCFLNAANEVLVGRFLNKKIGWIEIGQKLETLMDGHIAKTPQTYEHLAEIDREARKLAERI